MNYIDFKSINYWFDAANQTLVKVNVVSLDCDFVYEKDDYQIYAYALKVKTIDGRNLTFTQDDNETFCKYEEDFLKGNLSYVSANPFHIMHYLCITTRETDEYYHIVDGQVKEFKPCEHEFLIDKETMKVLVDGKEMELFPSRDFAKQFLSYSIINEEGKKDYPAPMEKYQLTAQQIKLCEQMNKLLQKIADSGVRVVLEDNDGMHFYAVNENLSAYGYDDIDSCDRDFSDMITELVDRYNDRNSRRFAFYFDRCGRIERYYEDILAPRH